MQSPDQRSDLQRAVSAIPSHLLPADMLEGAITTSGYSYPTMMPPVNYNPYRTNTIPTQNQNLLPHPSQWTVGPGSFGGFWS